MLNHAHTDLDRLQPTLTDSDQLQPTFLLVKINDFFPNTTATDVKQRRPTSTDSNPHKAC